jgi:DNA polymerase-3 subunit epsilon
MRIDIPAEATEKHGISTEDARRYGRDPAEVATEVAEEVTKAWASGLPIIAYNASYDLTVLHREPIRHCRMPQGLLTYGPIGPVIDPLVIDKHIDRYRRGSRKLVDTCQHYGITLLEAHSASADTLATMRLAWKLAKRYPEIGAMSLAELQIAQAAWYRESQLSFATYLRSKVMMQAEPSDRPGIMERADSVEASADGWPMKHLPNMKE